MSDAERLAIAARELVGARFRLHGRDPASGLDCIGVLAASLAAIGRTARLPGAYSLRMLSPPDLDGISANCGLRPAQDPIQTGDILFVQVCAGQFHLLIASSPASFVHAHAGLRRIVEDRRPVQWPIIGRWRLVDPS